MGGGDYGRIGGGDGSACCDVPDELLLGGQSAILHDVLLLRFLPKDG